MPRRVDKRSRYAKAHIRTGEDRTGEELEYFELREIPQTEGVLHVVAKATDRLDLLAYRYYRDPTLFWKICDAADHLDPTDVVATHETVVIPPNK